MYKKILKPINDDNNKVHTVTYLLKFLKYTLKDFKFLII